TATLLTNSKMKIINVAELCGIYTISYFNKSFKKEFGESPSQYRKKHKTVSFVR
ncbi:MAG: helix-turn-helix transcriptional regulator, partial [Clostridia bacterium]|nr:helix-turn-helix transcriptional regulator [Clostridia bacterium]